MSKVKHIMIREWVEDQIHRGVFVEGQRLPTELELMEKFGVSRAPVQQAMRWLEHSGVVERRSGAGTFVSSAGIRSNLLNYLRPPRNEALEHGLHSVLRTRVTAASELSWCQGVFPGTTPVVVLDRVKVHTSGKPLVLERAAINLILAPAIMDEELEPLSTIPYYSSIGIHLERLKTRITAEVLNKEDAMALELDPPAPVVCQHRTVYDHKDRAVESAMYFTHPRHLILEVTQNISQ